MSRKTYVKLCRGEDDWNQLKLCFVRAFFGYPLFEYVMPELNKREEFLRRYLEAHYDVTVRNGNSLLVCVHLMQDNESNSTNAKQKDETSSRTKIIGGVLLTAPAKDGIGWEHEDDDVYEQAYRKFRLHEVDEFAFERLISFEAWETKHIISKLFALHVPIWNGVFCAIDPLYANAGVGTMNYADCMQIVVQAYMRSQDRIQMPVIARKRNTTETESCTLRVVDKVMPTCDSKEQAKYMKPTNSMFQNNKFWASIIHSLSLLSHHHRPLQSRFYEKAKHSSITSTKVCCRKIENVPLMIMLSQSQRAVEFHKRNGFNCVLTQQFEEPVLFDDCAVQTILAEYVLVCDLFGRGKLSELFHEFNDN
ncbi:uncharacterized protein LOC120342804 [Styela clava]|uniref:uncharacterized protein LOC120342804 n=1 Tax=Styela clava TaxID=7725 RepID=UPI001939488B|nr:uncharacterized protein LOC120342804 [Styela clava]XP_039267721.1 uncharacterized protein LOC120342804 [Styela clava]